MSSPDACALCQLTLNELGEHKVRIRLAVKAIQGDKQRIVT